MRKLGYFSYHQYKLTFTANESETLFKVKFFGKGLRVPNQIKEFETLGPARTLFEECVEEILHRTSRSDVSLFMQQGRSEHCEITLSRMTNMTHK